MKKYFVLIVLSLTSVRCSSWGFFAHRKINYYAVFLLPPEMLVLYKPHIQFLSEHAVDPDKRRYLVVQEAPRHFIDIDRYGKFPYKELPRKWDSAIARFGRDTVTSNGIAPWWILIMLQRLTRAFKEKNAPGILKLSAEIGHYISDAHVPLHANSNHNGQYTNQKGIHAFWESRIPELLADQSFSFFIGKAGYVKDPAKYIWERVMESGAAADSVLLVEKDLASHFPSDQKFGFETRNESTIRQYSFQYSQAYNNKLNGMIERRMRQSVYSTASLWYTAWVNAGQPDLKKLSGKEFSNEQITEFETLNLHWKNDPLKGRSCEE